MDGFHTMYNLPKAGRRGMMVHEFCKKEGYCVKYIFQFARITAFCLAGEVLAAVLPLLAAKMAPGGVVLCETEREADLPEQAGSLTLVKQYNYGKIKVSRYERGEEA